MGDVGDAVGVAVGDGVGANLKRSHTSFGSESTTNGDTPTLSNGCTVAGTAT